MALDNFRRIDMQINRANDYQLETQFAKEGDYNGRELVVQITNAGEISNQTGVSLNLGWHHDDVGNSGLDPFTAVDASKGIFKITYPTEMLIAGDVTASIQVLDGEKITLTRNFKITVERNPLNEDTIVSENSFTVLQEALKTVSQYDSRIANVEANKSDKTLTDELTVQLGQMVINVLHPPIPLQKADPSGNSDNTDIIQGILNYIGDNGGKIFFPKGIYLKERSLNSPKNIIWCGVGAGSVIKTGGFNSPIKLSDNNVFEYLTVDGNHSELGSEDSTLNTNIQPSGKNILIKDCYFKGSIGSSISSSDGVNVTVRNNVIDGYQDHAVYFSTNSNGIVIEGNMVDGLSKGSECFKVRNGVYDVVIKNNIVHNVSAFLNLTAELQGNKNIIIDGNIATTINHSIIAYRAGEVFNESIEAINNDFENIGDYVALSLYWNLKLGVKNIKILHNTFLNYNGLGSIRGDSGSVIASGIDILENTFHFKGSSALAIMDLANIELSKINGNRFIVEGTKTNLIYVTNSVDIEMNDNVFDATQYNSFLDLNNSSDVKINLKNNKIKKGVSWFIIDEDISGDSLVILENNDVESGYTNFYNAGNIEDHTKYIIKSNIFNGAPFIKGVFGRRPSFIGEIAKDSTGTYIALDTQSVDDWKLL